MGFNSYHKKESLDFIMLTLLCSNFNIFFHILWTWTVFITNYCVFYISCKSNSFIFLIYGNSYFLLAETLRKYPPLGFLSRVVTKPYVLPGTSVKLDIGQKILISVYGLHHDAKYYPDPERFNPENFSNEAKAARPHYTYLPFGEGPRNCIGEP